MPVITPTYPAFNSTYNISQSTKAVLMSEFARGYEITSGIEKGTHQWSDLFDTLKFFSNFTIYIRINCTAPTKEEHFKLSGLVESRIRFMINKLDATEGVKYAHPFTNSIHFVDENDPTSQNCAYFLGLCYHEGVRQITITPAVTFFRTKVEELKSEESAITVEVITKNKLPDFVFPGGVRPPVPVKRKRKAVPQANGTDNSPKKATKIDENDTPSSVIALSNVSTPEVQDLLSMELSQPSSALSINSSITLPAETTTS
jgi:poly(A) polymerase